MLSTENSGNVQPVIPGSPAYVPVQAQVPANQIVEQVDADRVGMEAVMQFVANTFAGAMVMDSHSVSSIKGILCTANVALSEPLYMYQVVKERKSLGCH